jgi:hypothetical protein
MEQLQAILECADMSALCLDATCRVDESGDLSPHSMSWLTLRWQRIGQRIRLTERAAVLA